MDLKDKTQVFNVDMYSLFYYFVVFMPCLFNIQFN